MLKYRDQLHFAVDKYSILIPITCLINSSQVILKDKVFNTAPLGKCLPVTCLVKMKMNLEVHVQGAAS